MTSLIRPSTTAESHSFPNVHVQGLANAGTQFRKNRVVCTLTQEHDRQSIARMISNGMSCIRVNFTHTSSESLRTFLDEVRAAEELAGQVVGLICDTTGSEIRLGPFKNGKGVQVETGQSFTLHINYLEGDESGACVNLWDMTKILKVGDMVYINYGLVCLKVKSIGRMSVETVVENSGFIGANKVVLFRGHHLDMPALTYKDTKDIDLAVKNGFHIIAASYVSTAQDIIDIKSLPQIKENNILVFAKIMSVEAAVVNFDSIMAAADGIILARSPVSCEVPVDQVCTVQKHICQRCRQIGKPILIVNQVLNSMSEAPRPTRAEATDVFNALLDGVDGVILTNTSATGMYAQECVETLDKIYFEAEKSTNYRSVYHTVRENERGMSHNPTNRIKITEMMSLASSCVKTAWDTEAKMMLVLDNDGTLARTTARYRPHCPVLCLTKTKRTAAQLSVTYAVIPELVATSKEQTYAAGILIAKQRGLVKQGDIVVALSDLDTGDYHQMQVIEV
eukprot:TRINITY_DN736_c0_g1_i2.p1 TRINITY_DN736_c0_g1~~TRINITY_DN736_c0_g1_i2.p1  ORF type:complete len:517 (-),score=127.19 TRINITY_DN736_c0_g1_i2:173-1696(-)